MSENQDETLIGLGGVREALEARRQLKQLWTVFLKSVGIGEEAGTRLTILLILHLTLDRAITELLAWHFTRAPSLDKGFAVYENIAIALADLPISKRVDLLKASGLLLDGTIGDIRAFNRLRNKFAHSDPKHKYKLKHVEELSSVEAFLTCVEKGLNATNTIRDKLGESMGEYSKRVPEQSDPTPT